LREWAQVEKPGWYQSKKVAADGSDWVASKSKHDWTKWKPIPDYVVARVKSTDSANGVSKSPIQHRLEDLKYERR